MLIFVYNIFMSEKKQINKKTNTSNKTSSNNKFKAEKQALENKIKILESKIQNLEKEKNEATNSFLDKAKGFQDKAKKQIEKFKEEHKTQIADEINLIKKYAPESIVKELIEPLLNLELAIQAGKKQDNKDVNNYVIGFEMLLKQINQILENHDIKRICPSVGDLFDPETMDAISTKEDKSNADKVIEIKKIGYQLHDRVIKPAVVVIGK